MAKRKTPVQRAIEKRKKSIKRGTKRARKQLVRRGKKLKRTTKRVRKKVAKQRRKLVRISKRRGKKIRKNVGKRIRKYKRNRAKIARAQYRRSDISKADESLLDGTEVLKKYKNDPGSSNPGEPPKMRTGKGRDSIKAELITHKKRKTDVASRTYVDKRKAAYMAMWEYRKDGEERPFLKPSLEDNRKILGNIIGQSLKKKLRRAR